MRKLLVAIFLLTQLTFALDRQPNADYHMRRQALASRANAVVLVFAPIEAEGPNDLYGFRQDDNFFYLSGWAQPGAALLIAPAADGGKGSPARPYTEILFLPAHNRVQEKWTGPKLGPDDAGAAQATGFDRVEAIDDLRAELVRLLSEGKATVYTDVPTHGEISNSATPLEWLNRANAFPLNVSFQDVRPLLASLRTFKDGGEIELLRKAADASIAAHLAASKRPYLSFLSRQSRCLISEFLKKFMRPFS